jgi:hypothetical protein
MAGAAPCRRVAGRVVDVCESEEAFQRFGQRLLPELEQAGFPPAGPPQIFSAHNVVRQ